jgi:hypothetical protein
MVITKYILILLNLGGLEVFAKIPKISWETFSSYDLKDQKIGPELKKVMGKNITVTGFMIPLDYSEKKVKEFLLVPYYPSCAHVPPPPANQIIKVTMKAKSEVNPSYYPVEVTGKTKLLKSKKQDPDAYMPRGVFAMDGLKLKELKD